jgi:hypothetical protein
MARSKTGGIVTYIIECRGKYKNAKYFRSINEGTQDNFKSKAAAKVALAANAQRCPDENTIYRIREVKAKK